MSLPVIDNYQQLFLSDTRLLDLRAPVEFQQGAFPCSRNIPLLNDEERHQVGLCYKTKGQEKAIELGHQLVSGEVRAQRLQAWADYLQQHNNVAIYCFRGGMRSRITQQWLYEFTGQAYPLIKGGYKALRQYLLAQLELAANTVPFCILSGRTGSGKTLLLQQLQRKVDLEGLYHHRGSVFGRHVDAQPAQIDIENCLAIELMKHMQGENKTVVFEDESACIGARRVPQVIVDAMRKAPVVLLEVALDERIEVIYNEYVVEARQEYVQAFGELQGTSQWQDYLLTAIDKIRKRLGGKAHQEIRQQLELALRQTSVAAAGEAHRCWIAQLLTDYYDPMYDYQLSKKAERIVYRGDRQSVLAYLGSLSL